MDVTGQSYSLEDRCPTLLVAKERHLLLRGGNMCRSLSEDYKMVVVEGVNDNVCRWFVGSGEEGELIGQGAYLLFV